MNGLYGLPLEEYTLADLESKDTYIDMLPMYYASANQAMNLDQFKDFLIDPKTKEYKKIKDVCDQNPEAKRIFRSDLRKSIYPRAALGATVGVGSALLADDLYKKYFKNKDKK